MLTKQQKEEWVKALRSGEYKQGKGELKTKDRYCCLGVLCEILGLALSEDGTNIRGYDRVDSYKYITRNLVDYLGHRLASMNDTEKKSFAEIADYIEENVEFV